MLYEPEKLILGENCEFSTDGNINGNIVVVGPSGSGKTCSIVEPRLLETTSSNAIVNLSKRRIFYKFKDLFLSRGYKVIDLNFANCADSEYCFEPLKFIKSDADIIFLARSFIENEKKRFTTADQYWDNAATSLLCALISYVILLKEEPRFNMVLDLMDRLEIRETENGSIATTLDRDFDIIGLHAPECFCYRCWRTFASLASIRTSTCIYSTLSTALDTMFPTELRRMMDEKPPIDYNDFNSGEKVIMFVTLPVFGSEGIDKVFNAIAIKQLFEIAERRPEQRLKRPVTMIFDDFCTGKIADFPKAISVFREKGISCIILLQSESQLDALYHTHSTTILNNCDTYIYLGSNEVKTARSVAERANLPIEDVLYMGIGDEIIFRRGEKAPILTRRYDVLSDKELQRLEKNAKKRSMVIQLSRKE